MNNYDTKPKTIPALKAVMNPETLRRTIADTDRAEIFIALLTLTVTEGVKLGAELLIRKITRH